MMCRFLKILCIATAFGDSKSDDSKDKTDFALMDFEFSALCDLIA